MNEMEPKSHNLPSAGAVLRGEAIIEFSSAILAIVTNGFSEIGMIPLRRLLKKRIQVLEESITSEIRNGRISASDAIEEEYLASFILRVSRAALEGTGKEKLRLMARIFFNEAKKEHFLEDRMQDFWAITEQLTRSDMIILSILKKARQRGIFDEEGKEDRESRKIDEKLDLDNLFPDDVKFREAVIALLRFGFIDAVSGWGSLVYFITDRCLDYIDHIDFDEIDSGITSMT